METFRRSYLAIVVLGLLEKMGESYGYELCGLVRKKTGGKYTLHVGPVYMLLAGLEKRGFIESEARPSPEGPARKYVKLTQKGKDYLTQEKKTPVNAPWANPVKRYPMEKMGYWGQTLTEPRASKRSPRLFSFGNIRPTLLLSRIFRSRTSKNSSS